MNIQELHDKYDAPLQCPSCGYDLIIDGKVIEKYNDSEKNIVYEQKIEDNKITIYERRKKHEI